ncbi:hypothetical protein ACFS5M_03985 [Lacinutrix iliipiscaria]|uniref:Uncharacterized protein n=1 Tax=Lacinutrix iliipiscaria TaxID=1230532 RepID=A0ABW5WLQ7_9FLAO
MAEKLITIKEIKLNNNCPECYNTNGLQLTFKQKFKETTLYKSITDETTQEIECKTCNTIIYPVMWTDDIERVFEYQRKAFTPKKSSIKLKKKAWLLIALLGILIIAGVAVVIGYK